MMLEPSTTEEGLGCLGSILGILCGAWLGLQHFGAHVREELAENPDAAIDGTPALAAMGLGALVGLFTGAVLGMLVARVLRRESTSGSSKTAPSQGPANFGLVEALRSADNSATDEDSSIHEDD